MKTISLSPPNRSALWSSLALTKSQLADLCGVTIRQVSHWTLKGYLTTSSHHPDRYSGEAIDLCTLVKQGLDHGLPLRRAVGQARAFLSSAEQHRPVLAAIEPMALADIHTRLHAAQDALTTIIQVVEPLIPRQPQEAEVADAAAG